MASVPDRLRSQAQLLLPEERVLEVMQGQVGPSPTIQVFGSLALVMVLGAALAVVRHVPVSALIVLLLPAVIIVVLGQALLAKSRLVAVTQDAFVVIEYQRRVPTRIVGRFPQHLTVQHYWDERWLRVTIGDEQLWIGKRFFGDVVEKFEMRSSGW